jgi:hypothetical protein
LTGDPTRQSQRHELKYFTMTHVEVLDETEHLVSLSLSLSIYLSLRACECACANPLMFHQWL